MKKKSAIQRLISSMEGRPAEVVPPLPAGISQKFTISFFPADLEALKTFYAAIEEHCGVRASRSDAVKLALRAVVERAADPDALRRHLAAIKREDGRNKSKE